MVGITSTSVRLVNGYRRECDALPVVKRPIHERLMEAAATVREAIASPFLTPGEQEDMSYTSMRLNGVAEAVNARCGRTHQS